MSPSFGVFRSFFFFWVLEFWGVTSRSSNCTGFCKICGSIWNWQDCAVAFPPVAASAEEKGGPKLGGWKSMSSDSFMITSAMGWELCQVLQVSCETAEKAGIFWDDYFDADDNLTNHQLLGLSDDWWLLLGGERHGLKDIEDIYSYSDQSFCDIEDSCRFVVAVVVIKTCHKHKMHLWASVPANDQACSLWFPVPTSWCYAWAFSWLTLVSHGLPQGRGWNSLHRISSRMFKHGRRKFVLFGLLRDKDGNVIGKDGKHKNLNKALHND